MMQHKMGVGTGSARRFAIWGTVCLIACAVAAPAIAGWPEEGRWSIAVGWDNGWPAQWHHADAEPAHQQHDDWTIHHGVIALPEGEMRVRDAERVLPNGLTEIRRRWEWAGDEALETLTLSIRWQAELRDARPMLPGISYYDNPAGQSVDATRIPVITAAGGDRELTHGVGMPGDRRGFYEEHRFPMTFACVEGLGDNGLSVAALHTLPSPVPRGNRDDQWWSLGVAHLGTGVAHLGTTDNEERVELAAYTGAVASNGRNAVIKGHQRKWHAYDHAWCTMRPGDVVEKTFYLQTETVERRGSGFQKPLWAAVELAGPYPVAGFPPLEEVIAKKFADTLQRWRIDPAYAGIKAFPAERDWIDLGWAGQSEAFAYPMLQLGASFGIDDRFEYIQQGLDFITTSPFTASGFSIRYDMDQRAWLKRRNPLSQGQTVQNMLYALRLAREHEALDTRKWEAFLKRACDHHADQILAEDWRPVSTNEGFLIAPLAQAAELLDDARYREAALKAGEHYLDRHLSMDEPYWGGTLDARCEDKEGAWAALQGFLALYELTEDRRWLDAAIHAGDVVLSYAYLWDVPMPAGRLADHGFRSRGWTTVSAQNMHLDVYGVLCTPAFWRLGELTGNPTYQSLARLMLVSCGQLVDPTGHQGEQMHQTNYAQHYDYDSLTGVRGDYAESWNVYWISAHFLVAVSQLDEWGVDWRSW